MDLRNMIGKKEISGSFPEHGAIFMSNRSTMKECFKRRIFGLPYSLSDFVSGVKAGMVLFLFEYEQRKLYGVFEAVSDGGVNIVPRAYYSSGKKFPAQVKFTTIWQCDPLYEHEFCKAIRDNYFAPYKFNFGLSMDQIQSLLWLFNEKKLTVPKFLCFNKWKGRKQSHMILESQKKKGKFTQIESATRELNLDASISVQICSELFPANTDQMACSNQTISENEFPVGRQPASADLRDIYGRPKWLPCDDDAYDPDYPGYYSAGLELHRVSAAANESGPHSNNDLGHDPVMLPEVTENLNISSKKFISGLEDFIPLSSPDHSDFAKEENLFFESEHYWEEHMGLATSLGNKDSLPLNKHLPLLPTLDRDGAFNQMKVLTPIAPSSPERDGNSHLRKVSLKGMYADIPNKRASVFSRLNMSGENHKGAGVNKSGNAVLEGIQQSSYTSGKQAGKDKLQKHETEDCDMVKRTSVFMRLTGYSDAVKPEVHSMANLEQENGEWKKRKREQVKVSKWRNYDEVDESVKQAWEVKASNYVIQEVGYRDDMSVPEIMGKLCRRHEKWRNVVNIADSIKHGDKYHGVNKKNSGFSSLARKRVLSRNDWQKTKWAISPDNERKGIRKVNKITNSSATLQKHDSIQGKMVRENKASIWNCDPGKSKSPQREVSKYAYHGTKTDLKDTMKTQGTAEESSTFKTDEKKVREKCHAADDKQECFCDNHYKSRLMKALFDCHAFTVQRIINNSLNMQMSSQESSASKERSGSGGEPVKSNENDEGNGSLDKEQAQTVLIHGKSASDETDKSLTDQQPEEGELVGTASCGSSDFTKALKTYKHGCSSSGAKG